MNKDLLDFCQMFLVPASILFAAIGIAQTEWLKGLISAMGAGMSALWCYRVHEWPELTQPDYVTAFGLGLTFGGTAAISAIVHFIRAMLGLEET
jgi:hypothetical protein